MTTGPARDALIAGRYATSGEVKQGAVGVVLAATDALLRRQVAVKEVRLPGSLPAEERQRLRERLLREVRAAARVVHPGVVTVFDVVEDSERVLVVTELVPGESLQATVERDGPLPPARAARLGSMILAALAAAHQRGITHQDVQPDNVLLLPDGRAKLSDLGLAFLSLLPEFGGTPARPNRDGPAADLRGLGTTLRFAVGTAAGPLTPAVDILLRAENDRPVAVEAVQNWLSQAAVDGSPRLAPPEPEPQREARREPAPADRPPPEAAPPGDPPPPPPTAGAPGSLPAAQLPPTEVPPLVLPAPEPGRPPPRTERRGRRVRTSRARAGLAASAALRQSTAPPVRTPTRPPAGSPDASPAGSPDASLAGSAGSIAGSLVGGPAADRSGRALGPPLPGVGLGVEPDEDAAAGTLRRPGRWARSRVVVASLVAGAVVAGAATVALLIIGNREPTDASPTQEPAATFPPVAGDPLRTATVPPGWQALVDAEARASLAVPPGWTLIQDRTAGVTLREEATGSSARLLRAGSPAAEPVAEPERAERTFQSGSVEGYRRIRLGPATFRDQPAAEWEYTFTRGGTDWHALDLYFNAGGAGWSLTFQAPQAQWTSASVILDDMRGSFRLTD